MKEPSNVKIEQLFEETIDFETFSKSDFRAVKILECEAVPKSKKLLKFVLDDGIRSDCVILSGIHEFDEPKELIGKTAIAIVNLHITGGNEIAAPFKLYENFSGPIDNQKFYVHNIINN